MSDRGTHISKVDSESKRNLAEVLTNKLFGADIYK